MAVGALLFVPLFVYFLIEGLLMTPERRVEDEERMAALMSDDPAY